MLRINRCFKKICLAVQAALTLSILSSFAAGSVVAYAKTDPIAIPGRVEAESFNEGGEGVAYHDLTGTNDGDADSRKKEGVEVWKAATGMAVGSEAGEWVCYTLDADETEHCKISVSASNGESSAAVLKLYVDSKMITDTATVDSTKEWSKYQTFDLAIAEIRRGKHIFKYEVMSGRVSLDYFDIAVTTETELKPRAEATPAPVITPGPYKEHVIPGKIEAEYFDNGERGKAYYSTDVTNVGDANFRTNDAANIWKIPGEGMVIGTRSSEWFNYTVTVEATGYYMLRMNAGSGSGTSSVIKVSVDGNILIKGVAIKPSGDWNTIQTYDVGIIQLTAGTHVIKMEFPTAAVSVDYFEFFKSGPPKPTPTPSPRPTPPPCPTPPPPSVQASFYVSPVGSDNNDGSIDKPFATLEKARDSVRAINKDMTGDIIVYLRGGTYSLQNTLVLTEADSGTNGYNVIYKAYEKEEPIISGGDKITGWEQVPGKPYWKAAVTANNFRQLYVNGQRAQRARTNTRMLGTAWYDDPRTDEPQDGIVMEPDSIPEFTNVQNMELHWGMEWRDPRLPVRDIITTKDGKKAILLKQPYLGWTKSMEYDRATPSYDYGFFIENAFELMDTPGEWYYDKNASTLYYYPLEGQRMETAEVYAPRLEFLMKISGSTPSKKVHNIQFKGLKFRYGSWLKPNDEGYATIQAEMMVAGPAQSSCEGGFMLPAQIQVDNAKYIVFERNEISHMGSVGISMKNGVEFCAVIGNVISDISAAAVTVGTWTHDYIDEPDEEACKYVKIENNVIRNTAEEYWGDPAITAYYVEGVNIVHNDIASTGGGGISVGWGWSNRIDSTTCKLNNISYNRIQNIEKYTNDSAGVYTLGQQPGTIVSNNYINYNPDFHGGLYHDQGSAYIKTYNNVIENCRIWLMGGTSQNHDIQIDNNYTTVEDYLNEGIDEVITNTHFVPDAKWPKQAQDIINNSGVEDAYKDIAVKYPVIIPKIESNKVRMQAEDYDQGGEGVGYHKINNAKTGNIMSRNDPITLWGYNLLTAVGSTNAGEWLCYTREFPESGPYKFILRASNGFKKSDPESKVNIYVDDKLVINDAVIALTKNWDDYQENVLGQAEIEKGTHKVKVEFVGNGFSFDCLDAVPLAPKAEPGAAFTDIQDNWAKDEIKDLVARKVVSGIDETHFAPDSDITRAQFITLVLRATKIPTKKYEGVFKDVQQGAWYADVLQAANDAGLIDKAMCEQGMILPEQPITREEMTSIIVNGYEAVVGQKLNMQLARDYSDKDEIAPWAARYVAVADSLGIITGVDDAKFAPAQKASRARAAVIIKRLLSQLMPLPNNNEYY